MITKTITYKDYNGEERTEDFMFHFTQAELAEMDISTAGGLDALTKRIIAEKNGAKIVEMFKDILKKSYGVKSDDGRRFMKSPEISRAFMETEAYSQLFMELATNAESASEFINGVIRSV